MGVEIGSLFTAGFVIVVVDVVVVVVVIVVVVVVVVVVAYATSRLRMQAYASIHFRASRNQVVPGSFSGRSRF